MGRTFPHPEEIQWIWGRNKNKKEKGHHHKKRWMSS